VSAPEIEVVTVDALRAAYPDDARLDDRALVAERLERIVLRAGSIAIYPSTDPESPVEVAWSPRPSGGRREILPADGSNHNRGIKAEARTVLLRSIALGRRWLEEVLGGTSVDQIAARERCTKRHVVNTVPLAFLAPDIIRAVVDARLPRGISTRSIAEPELEWSRQWRSLGINPGTVSA
jgi:hypothetical protein